MWLLGMLSTLTVVADTLTAHVIKCHRIKYTHTQMSTSKFEEILKNYINANIVPWYCMCIHSQLYKYTHHNLFANYIHFYVNIVHNKDNTIEEIE